jgi:hypothetical protein
MRIYYAGGGQEKWALWQFCPTTEESLKNALESGCIGTLAQIFEVFLFQTQTTPKHRILPDTKHGSLLQRYLEISFSGVQTQTMTAYCRILPTLNHHV